MTFANQSATITSPMIKSAVIIQHLKWKSAPTDAYLATFYKLFMHK